MWHFVLLAGARGECPDDGTVWEIVSTGCEVRDGCFSTVGFNTTEYTKNLDCSARLCVDGTFAFHGLSTEAGGEECNQDSLTWKGVKYCGYMDMPSNRDDGFQGHDTSISNLPSELTGLAEKGATARFQSDANDNYHGFEICVTPSSSETPTTTDEKGQTDGLTDGELAGIIVGAAVGGTALAYGAYRYGHSKKDGGGNSFASVGDLVF